MISIRDLTLDLRFALRTLIRRPAFALISTLELALGVIGKTVVMDSKPFVSRCDVASSAQ